MGAIHDPQGADFYRDLERLAEQQQHAVFIIQDKRSIHDEARRHGIEFMVGDKDAPKVELNKDRYVEKYHSLLPSIPADLKWVSKKVLAEGHSYLEGKKGASYQIDGFNIADEAVYSRLMTVDEPVVICHFYPWQAQEGEGILLALFEAGMSVPYTALKRASGVRWDSSWGEKPEQSKDEGDFVYTPEIVLAFRARHVDEARAISEIVLEKCSEIWAMPDVRCSKPIEGFESRFLNVKEMGSQELCILTTGDWIRQDSDGEDEAPYDDAFDRFEVFVNPLNADIVKSLHQREGNTGKEKIIIVDG